MSLPEKEIQALFKCYEEERFQDAKDLLDQAIDKDMNNHHIYYFKAICCIHMNKLDEAMINLGEVAYLNPDYTPSMHAIAYIFLRKGDFESAMDKWLAIKTIAPKDPLVNTILNKVKTKQIQKDFLNRYNMEDFILLDSKEVKRGLAFTMEEKAPAKINLNPQISKIDIPRPSITTHPSKSFLKRPKLKSLFISLIIMTSMLFLIPLIYKQYKEQKTYQEFAKLSQEPVLFSFQEEEIKQKQSEILKLLKTKDYNKTVLALNELYYSNAGAELKKAVKDWKGSIKQPQNIKEVGENILVAKVIENPFLYQGIFVEKEGSVSNFLKRPQYITFDLEINPSLKISNMYFLDNNTDELPFNNKDRLKIFGFIRLDEHNQPFIEDTSVKLLKTSPL